VIALRECACACASRVASDSAALFTQKGARDPPVVTNQRGEATMESTWREQRLNTAGPARSRRSKG